jgi:hypothetical protein
MYQRNRTGTIRRLADNACIPTDEANRDYRDYLAWVADGNTPLEADPPPVAYNGTSRIEARLRTTDGVAAQVYRATLAARTGYTADLRLIAVDAGNGAARVIKASVAAKRLNAGALLVGTPVVVANHADTGAAGWGVGASVAGDDFVITVTGAAGRTIDWLLDGTVTRFGPGGLTD